LRKGAPATTAEVLGNTLVCPDGHRLPFRTGNGHCTPMYCSDPEAKQSENEESTEAVRDLLKQANAQEQEDSVTKREKKHISFMERKLRVRLKALGVPETEDPEEIEKWADKRMVQMLRVAVGQVEERLRWGRDHQQWEAAQQVLASTGRGRREAILQSQAPMVLVVAQPGMENLPYLRRVAPTGTSDPKQLQDQTKK
jgi:hypothetical protein